MELWEKITIGLYLLWAARIIFAWRDGFFTVGQMKKKGFKKGLPASKHEATYLNPFVFLVLACIMSKYAGGWSRDDVKIAVLFSIAVTVIFVTFWVKVTSKDCPEADAHDGRLPMAGVCNAIMMIASFSVAILYFWHSTEFGAETFAISAVFALYLTCCTHIIWGLLGSEWFPGKPQKDPVTIAIIIASWAPVAFIGGKFLLPLMKPLLLKLFAICMAVGLIASIATTCLDGDGRMSQWLIAERTQKIVISRVIAVA